MNQSDIANALIALISERALCLSFVFPSPSSVSALLSPPYFYFIDSLFAIMKTFFIILKGAAAFLPEVKAGIHGT